MTELSFYTQALEPNIIKSVCSFDSLPLITAIRFLRHRPVPSPDTLYVGTPREAERFLRLNPHCPDLTLFVTGSDEALLSLAQKQKVNLICTTLDLLDIHDRISDRMHQSLTTVIRSETSKKAGIDSGFATLLDDIVKNRLTNEAEIDRRLALLQHPPERFLSFVIIEFEPPGGAAPADRTDTANGHAPDSRTELYSRLEALFPGSSLAEYEHNIVILLGCPDRMYQPTPIFDSDGFKTLLSQYNAFAAISNATSRRFRLHTSYVLTQRILRLGRALRAHPADRIFYFEDYAEYYMIDLCFNSFSELFGHNDIIYLTHPDAIALARYDQKNNTNLLDVMYYYCMNNENIVKTARAAYMHRNTVTAKISRIREIIRADPGSGQIRQRMIFSYKILRYYEKYAGIDIEERLSETNK